LFSSVAMFDAQRLSRLRLPNILLLILKKLISKQQINKKIKFITWCKIIKFGVSLSLSHLLLSEKAPLRLKREI